MRFSSLFSLSHSLSAPLFERVEQPWQVLSLLHDYILSRFPLLPSDYREVCEGVYAAANVRIPSGVYLSGPCIIGQGVQLRPGAYIRGDVLIGENCVIGNSTEIKSSILFDGVQAPHFNYVGDSILGYKVHLGAGVILSNLRSDKRLVRTWSDNGHFLQTDRRKLGAVVGDECEIGCQSVLCPGTVLERGISVYPLSMVRGFVRANETVKKASLP